MRLPKFFAAPHYTADLKQTSVPGLQGVELLARVPDEFGGHPLLVAGQFEQGRTLAWTSDIGPHWLTETFATWHGYARLWQQALAWLIGER